MLEGLELRYSSCFCFPGGCEGGFGEFDFVGGGHVGVCAAEIVDVGVAFAGCDAETLLEAVDEEVGAFYADGVVDVGASREDLEEPVRGFQAIC